MNDKELLVFLPNFRIDGWEDRKTHKADKSLIGKSVPIALLFLCLSIKKAEKEKDKEILQISHSAMPQKHSNVYRIVGKVEEVQDDYFTVDCGLTSARD